MAPLAICRRIDFPALFQGLADLALCELFLLRKILMRVVWLTIFRDKLRRLNIIRFPIEIENLIFGPQIIFGVAVAIQAPRHAVWLGDVNRRHVVHRTVAAEATDAAVNVCRVIVINVINRAIEPDPFDGLTALPAFLHRLELWIILCHLRVAVHARLRVRHIGLSRHFHEAVTIATIHPQLCHVNIVRKRHRLGRLVSDLGIFRRCVIPRGGGQAANDHNDADDHLDRYPIRPAWKEIGHVLDGLRADAAQSPSPPRRIRPVANYRSTKTVLRMCFVQALQRVKVNCFSGEQRGFYECTARGQNKISFSTSGAGRS